MVIAKQCFCNYGIRLNLSSLTLMKSQPIAGSRSISSHIDFNNFSDRKRLKSVIQAIIPLSLSV